MDKLDGTPAFALTLTPLVWGAALALPLHLVLTSELELQAAAKACLLRWWRVYGVTIVGKQGTSTQASLCQV